MMRRRVHQGGRHEHRADPGPAHRRGRPAARLFRSGGARSQAQAPARAAALRGLRRGLDPGADVWNRIARLVGVGRGTDMVLYALVVAFLSFTVTTYLRFREFEVRYTRLARRLALDEAARDYPRTDRSGGRGDGGDVLDEPDRLARGR